MWSKFDTEVALLIEGHIVVIDIEDNSIYYLAVRRSSIDTEG